MFNMCSFAESHTNRYNSMVHILAKHSVHDKDSALGRFREAAFHNGGHSAKSPWYQP